ARGGITVIDQSRVQARILGTHTPGVEEARLEAWAAVRPRLVAALHPLPIDVVEAVHDALLALIAADVLTVEQRRALAGPLGVVLGELLETAPDEVSAARARMAAVGP